MADNVISDPGAGGATFATDERAVDSVHFPLTKLVWGALDTFNVVSTGASALPVQDGGNSLTVDGTVAVSAVSGTVTVDGSGVTQPVSHAALTELAAALNASNQMDVNIAASAVTLSVSNAGTFAVQADTELTTADLDTGAGTDTRAVVGLVGTASGGGQLIPGSATDGLLVNLGANNDVTITGTASLTGEPVFTDDAAFTPATSKVMVMGLQADETATDSVDEGDAGAPRMTLDRKMIVAPQPHAAGGLSIFRSLDLDETEEDVKTAAGCIYGLWATNTATTTRWLKFYNATAANVTVGTTTPVITWGIPGNTSDDISAVFGGGMGIMFDTAISVAATTGVADADTGAPAANDVIVNVFYK